MRTTSVVVLAVNLRHFFSSCKRSANCADADEVLCAISTAGGFRVGTLEDMSHILLFLLLVCQGLCVVPPPGWSWREEEWDSRREKVEEKKEKLGRGK